MLEFSSDGLCVTPGPFEGQTRATFHYWLFSRGELIKHGDLRHIIKEITPDEARYLKAPRGMTHYHVEVYPDGSVCGQWLTPSLRDALLTALDGPNPSETTLDHCASPPSRELDANSDLQL